MQILFLKYFFGIILSIFDLSFYICYIIIEKDNFKLSFFIRFFDKITSKFFISYSGL